MDIRSNTIQQVARRPQSLGGVNPTVAFWHWLDGLMYKTHRSHQFHPPRFHSRAVFLVLLILVPGFLWLRSVWQGPKHPLKQWGQGSCPALPPVSLEDLHRYPARFQHRTIWLQGNIDILPRQCLSSPCVSNAQPCCQPCQAPLILRSVAHFVRLDGWISEQNGPLQRLLCRGTTCHFSCYPIVLRKSYGVEGRVVLAIPPENVSIRPRFQLRHFQVSRLCLSNRQVRPQRTWQQPDPQLRMRVPLGASEVRVKTPTK